ncbi:MAG: hypothetical protein A7315_12850 [Candidatus Altiarchaeales archaeon WOR_SM1_79]|nr:MAG: hypothetical protein A7315_12850 [Candidatus Altiarchaeales archaeon WOR_SM1_79]
MNKNLLKITLILIFSTYSFSSFGGVRKDLTEENLKKVVKTFDIDNNAKYHHRQFRIDFPERNNKDSRFCFGFMDWSKSEWRNKNLCGRIFSGVCTR